MKILVTGADGFIGSHLVEKLIKIGHDVTALCYYNSFSSIGNLIYLDKKILKKVKIKHGDIRDKDFIEKLVKGKDYVFNLAALIGIPYSYDAYDSYLDTNIKGTLNLLSAIKKNPKIFFVHTSTSEVYGSAQYVPIDENHPQVAQSPYAATKIAADQLVVSFLKSFNIKGCIVRPFNTFGPRQSLRAIIPTAINQIINKPKNIDFGNLNTYRDLTYIEDTIDAFCLCIKNKDRIIGSIFNLGVGKCYLIKDVIKKIMRIESSKSNIVIKENRIRPKKSEVKKLVSSNIRAKKLINWKPKYSSQKRFDEALKKTINWFKENKNHSSNVDKYFI